MRKPIVFSALLLFTASGLAQSRNCLRVMPSEELTRSATLIARIKVLRASRASYQGEYSQIATLRAVDIIEGDSKLDTITVLAQANVRCAEDNYVKNEEMLVFLEPVDSLFHTLNFQYGQFPILGDVVKGWRDVTNRPIDRPYPEVRREIELYLNGSLVKPPEPETSAQNPTRGKPRDMNPNP